MKAGKTMIDAGSGNGDFGKGIKTRQEMCLDWSRNPWTNNKIITVLWQIVKVENCEKMLKRYLHMAFLALFILISVVPAYATSSRSVEAGCPVCGNRFSASKLMSTNNLGGYDSDLCPNARGYSPLMSRIWGCPACNFCGYSDEFEEKLSDARKSELKSWLANDIKVEKKESENRYDAISAQTRYEVAARIAEMSKKPALETGNLWLNAAWTCRHLGMIDVASAAEPMVEVSPETCKTLFQALDEYSRKIKPSENRAGDMYKILAATAAAFDELKIPESELVTTYLMLARLFRSTGENQQAENFIVRALAADKSGQIAREAEAIRFSMKEEARFQTKAAEWLEKALSQADVKDQEKIQLTLTLAETCRRIGDNDRAEKFFLQLFESKKLPEFFVEIARNAFTAMGRSQLFPEEKAKVFATQRVQEALSLLKDPGDGRYVAGFLRECADRATVFPELVKLIRGSDENAAENAVRCMSDTSAEALAIQLELFEQGRFVDVVLENLREFGSHLPAEPFAKAFSAAAASERASRLLELLVAIGGKTATDAILARAEKEFSPDGVRNLSKIQSEDYDQKAFYRNLITSLITCDDLRVIEVLQRVIKNAQVDGINSFGHSLLVEAGTAIEFVINHYLGFSIVITRERGPQFEQPDDTLHEKPFAIARNNLKEWLAANGAKPREQMIAEGFVAAGYKITPASDPSCLKELIAGLSDRLYPIRYHSYNALARLTGVSYKPFIGRDPKAYPKVYREIIWFYTDWLDKNLPNLKFNEDKGCFEILENR